MRRFRTYLEALGIEHDHGVFAVHRDMLRLARPRAAHKLGKAGLGILQFPGIGSSLASSSTGLTSQNSIARLIASRGKGHPMQAHRGAAARCSRSLIASPRPWCGTGMTAMAAAPAASSARRCENRLAAASMRSPRFREIEHGLAAGPGRARAEGEQRFAGAHLGRVEPQSRLRRIVRGEQAGREPGLVRRCGAASAGASASAPSACSIAARGRPPGRSSTGEPRQATMVEFDADRRRPAVDDQVDAAAQIGEHMGGGGRRDVAGAVGRGRHHRAAECRQDGARNRMVGHAHADGIEAGGRKLGDRTVRRLSATPASAAPARSADRRSAAASNRASRRAPATSPTCAISGLNAGAALGGKEARDRLAVGGIGAEPIDGLGWKRDEPAGSKRARRRADRPRARRRCDHLGRRLMLRLRGSFPPLSIFRLEVVHRRRAYKIGHQSECSAVW